MFRLLCLALLLLSNPLIENAAVAQEKKPEIVKGWGTFIDPDADCKIRQEKNKLTIVVPKTHHDLTYSDQYTKLNAPRVLQDAKGDFRVDVKVLPYPLPAGDTSSAGRFSFVSVGLVIWQDEKNFVRMDRAAEGNTPSPFIWVERFQNGSAVSQKLHGIENKDTYLRVIRTGDKLTFQKSDDGKDWLEVHSEEAKMSEALKIGIGAINTTTREFAPDLEDLHLERSNVK